jgi:hypothetical protein
MKIAVDGMGGDYAPQAIVEGLCHAQEHNAIILVEDEPRLARELDRLRAHHLPMPFAMREVVHMEEAPGWRSASGFLDSCGHRVGAPGGSASGGEEIQGQRSRHDDDSQASRH